MMAGMRVAAPVFGGRISPVFDWARRLLVVDHNRSHEKGRHEISLEGVAPLFRARHVAGLGVQTLICGGISAPVAATVESQGVMLIAGVVGEVDAVLKAFLAGRLPDPVFAMPGWRSYRHRMRIGARSRWGPRRGGRSQRSW